jgi:hypothetical protein
MKQATTKKLFFRKWPIKIECYVRGSYRIHRFGPEKVIEWIDTNKKTDIGGWSMWDRFTDKPTLKEFAKKLIPFKGMDHQVRAENGHYNIFVKDKSLRDKLVKELQPWVMCVTEPGTDAEWDFLMNSSHKKVLCSELPYSKFKYKLIFNENYESTAKTRCLEWINKYPDTMKVSGQTVRWLGGYYSYMQNPFMYIKDDKTLSMVLLYVSGNHKKVEEFILKDSINT